MAQQTLDQVVRAHLVESGDTTEHRYNRLLQIATSGLTQLNMDVSGVSQAVLLTKNSNDTVDLPAGYIDYTRIGICGDDGNFHSLGWNNRLCLPRSYDDCGDAIVPNGDITSDGIIWDGLQGPRFRNGEFTGRFFGIGGGNNTNGYYRIDNKDATIFLSGVEGTSIWLEYLADIESVNGNFMVHHYDEEALKAFIYFRDIRTNRTYSIGEKREARKYWIAEKGKAQRRHKSFTLDEALQSIRVSSQASPKF